MKNLLESKPNPALLEAAEKLKKLGFNPVFLSSEKIQHAPAARGSTEPARGKGITITRSM